MKRYGPSRSCVETATANYSPELDNFSYSVVREVFRSSPIFQDMASQWKSTPSYWCKFCAQYVRETPIERKKHETSGRHQGNIQRSLRELQKNKSREDRDNQRAKDEVARLNGLVSGDRKVPPKATGIKHGDSSNATRPGPIPSAAVQRKAHAEQLLALGVPLPEELQREITGVGTWQTVSERIVPTEDAQTSNVPGIKSEGQDGGSNMSKGVHKRRAEGDEEVQEAVKLATKKAWGSTFKSYPATDVAGHDLDRLLSGVSGTHPRKVKYEEADEGEDKVKEEDVEEKVLVETTPNDADRVPLKPEDNAEPPPVVFKKRKVKR